MKEKIAIILGSRSDLAKIKSGLDILKELKLAYELEIISAHRTPDLLQEYIMGEKQVITIDETHRTVNSNAMYAAIYQAYRDCKPEIIKTIQGE